MKKQLVWAVLFSLGLAGVPWTSAAAQEAWGLGARLQKLADVHDWEGEAAARTLARAWQLKIRPGGIVPVIIEPHFGTDPKSIDTATLERLGGTIDAVSRSYLRVLVPFRFLRRIVTHPNVRMVRAPTPAKVLGGLGSNVSESVGLTGAADLQAAGITGQGVKVAVVDLGFIGLSDAIAEGELPQNTVAVDLPGSNDNPIESSTEHGVGVAEHVMDMAPGATLYCIMVGDEVDLENAADYIRDNNIQVANHSVGWVNASYYDDTGPITSIINQSWDVDKVFWSVAAGNDAHRHWRGGWYDPDGDDLLNFFGSNDERMDLTSASGVTYVFLNWDQYGNSLTDLDLYVRDRRGRIVASSEGWQTGPQAPAEAVGFFYSSRWAPYRIEVRRYSGPTDGLDMTIFSFYNDLEYAVAAASLMEPADAHGAYSVGAIDQADWNDSDPSQEPYSSKGPTTDGRLKPNIVAPDGTTSLTYGIRGSFGTSFSAPTVMGAAALRLQQDPSLTPEGLADDLSYTAVDIGDLGLDTAFGAGQLNLAPVPATGPTVTIDQAATQLDPINAWPINFTVVFSEAVTGFETGDVTLSGTAGATTAVVTGSGTTYNVAVSGMTSDGTVIASIPVGVADGTSESNQASTSTDNEVSFDTTGPTVAIDQAAGQADPTNASPINFTVVFSEDVNGFDSTDVTLSGSAAATTALVNGSGTTYNVAVSGMTSDGTVIASIAAGKATDAAGNSNAASTTTDNEVTFNVPAGATTMHVHDLDAVSEKLQKGFWQATVTITVRDTLENPVVAVMVVGSFSQNGTVISRDCTTDGNGTCAIDSGQFPSKNGQASCTVDNMTVAGSPTYDPSANHDVDGDTNGTTINISK